MNKDILMKQALLSSAIAAALTFSAGTALAHQAGDVIVRAGITQVSPQEDSGKISTNFMSLGTTDMEVSVDSATALGLNFVYVFDESWAVELLLATPFEHDINLERSQLGLGNGALADARQLPPTLSVLYFFNEGSASFQPYVGLGINYTTFFEEEFESSRKSQGFSNLELDDSWGLSTQVGFDYQLTDQWLVNASVRYIDIDTKARFTIAGESSSVDVDIDPIVSSLMLAYKF